MAELTSPGAIGIQGDGFGFEGSTHPASCPAVPVNARPLPDRRVSREFTVSFSVI
jgi:hypothetical protein